MKIEQMEGRTGRPVANQFVIIEQGNGALGNFIRRFTFQSYNSLIASVTLWPDEKRVILDPVYWNYSRTTSKYLHKFLLEHGINKTTKEKEKALASGEFISENLNK